MLLWIVDCGLPSLVSFPLRTLWDVQPSTDERMNDTGKGGTGSYGIESNPVYGKFRGPHCNVARQGTLAAPPPTDAMAKSGSLESASWIWGPISHAG